MILHTTLNDATAVATPAAGFGAGSVNTNPPNDFVPAVLGDGVRLNGPTESVSYDQSTGSGMDNIDLSQGTIDFCYRTFYDSDTLMASPGEYGLFETTNESQGWIRVRVSGSNNGLQIITWSEVDQTVTEQIAPLSTFRLQPGEWHRITVSWDFTVGASVQNLFIYVDGVELAPNLVATTGPRTMGNPSTNGTIYLGSIAANNWDANGVIDDFKVYDRALVP